MWSIRISSLVTTASLALAPAIAAEAQAGTCEWVVESMPVDITWDQPGTETFDFLLQQPVSMKHVSSVGTDAIKMTMNGAGSSSATVQLLSGKDVVANLFGPGISSGSPNPLSITGRPGNFVDSTEIVDGIRFTITNSANVTTEVRGIHEDDTMIILFVVAPFAPDGPHYTLSLGALTETTVAASGASEWETVPLPPVPADGLRYSVQTGMGFDATGLTSGIVHSQLLFDNGVILTNDDYTSPSLGRPPAPEERWICYGGARIFDESAAEMIAGAQLIGWRWRVMASGSGTVTMIPPDEAFLFLHYDSVILHPADVNGDGVVDVQDLVEVITAWGANGGPADIDGDGTVGVEDLVELILNWGASC